MPPVPVKVYAPVEFTVVPPGATVELIVTARWALLVSLNVTKSPLWNVTGEPLLKLMLLLTSQVTPSVGVPAPVLFQVRLPATTTSINPGSTLLLSVYTAAVEVGIVKFARLIPPIEPPIRR